MTKCIIYFNSVTQNVFSINIHTNGTQITNKSIQKSMYIAVTSYVENSEQLILISICNAKSNRH